MSWTIIQGRRNVVNARSRSGLLWIEAAEMPTEFIGGILVVEGDGRPFGVIVRYGMGSVTFENEWSSPTGARRYLLIPACDAFFCDGYNANGSDMTMGAALSRDVRYWPGVGVPGETLVILAGGVEPMGGMFETGSATGNISAGVEPMGGMAEKGDAAGEPIASGVEPMGGMTETGELRDNRSDGVEPMGGMTETGLAA